MGRKKSSRLKFDVGARTRGLRLSEGWHILIAVAGYLAAHSPSERAGLQTADIARRLMRGSELHEAAADGQ